MYLNYTLPKSSRYILFLDAPFRYSWRHLIQYFNDNAVYKRTGIHLLTQKEQRLHFAFAFLEILPILGIFVAIVDRLLFRKKVFPVSHYTEKEKEPCRFVIEKVVPIFCKAFGNNAKKEASLQEVFILPRYIQEMKELANSINVPYGSILQANTILERRTITSGNKIDYPMGLLAPARRLFIHKKTPYTYAYAASGWLGILGTYSGVNEHGVQVAVFRICDTAKVGTPNHLILRQILEEAKSLAEATHIIARSTPSASMSLLVIAPDGIKNFELN